MAVPGTQQIELICSSVRGSEIADQSEHAGHVPHTLWFQGPLQGDAVPSMPSLCLPEISHMSEQLYFIVYAGWLLRYAMKKTGTLISVLAASELGG